jgi:hypothetical protein
MTELATGSNEFFGGDVPADIRAQIEAARYLPRVQMGERLWAIQERSPTCLPIYYLLYKHHATWRELHEAERAAVLGLRAAGELSGLPGDAEHALRATLPTVDFERTEPARFWLFTLKALAYIRLRSGRVEQARQLVDCIDRCDPGHSLGIDTISSLVAAGEAAD